jgi:hypothetical protein
VIKRFIKYITDHPAGIAAWVIILVVAWTNFDLKYWKNENRLLVWDVKAYYVYLPATVIYKDLSLKFVEEHRDEIGDAMFLERGPKGIYTIMTTYGLSFLYSPFFLAAHGITSLTSPDEANGYTSPYRLALVISCIFYLALGIFFLKKFLQKYFSAWVTAITLVAVVLGTNLYYYSTYEAPMSHAYNFAIISLFIYLTDRWYETISPGKTLALGFLVGLITLIRPVNLLVIIFFILWKVNSWTAFRERIFFLIKSSGWIALMAVVSFLVWIPQFIYWKYVSGSFLFYSYSEMGFFFNNPQIINSLFSYRKGLFLYIPLMAVAYLGIPFLYRKYPGFVLPVALFSAANVYVLASWCFWWFGGSFGPRSYIDTYAILALPFAAITGTILKHKWVLKIPYIVIVGAFVWFNFFQTKQYINGAISWGGMTKAAYWDSFLRKYPSKAFWNKLRFPNRENALKGIYYIDDLTVEELNNQNKKTEPQKKEINLEEREEYIRNLDKYIRSREKWFNEMKEKAARKGITVDSAIRKDGIWLYEMEQQKK